MAQAASHYPTSCHGPRKLQPQPVPQRAPRLGRQSWLQILLSNGVPWIQILLSHGVGLGWSREGQVGGNKEGILEEGTLVQKL